MQKYLEDLAMSAGLSYSDFVRMALSLGARQQAALLGVYDVQVVEDPASLVGRPSRPREEDKSEELREVRYFSDGKLLTDEEYEAAVKARLVRLGIGKKST